MKRNTYALKGMDGQGLAFTSQYTSIYKRTGTGKLCAQKWEERLHNREQRKAKRPGNVTHVTTDRTKVALKLGGLSLPERIAMGIPAEIARLHVGDWTSNDIKMAVAILG